MTWPAVPSLSLGWEDPLEKTVATHSVPLPGESHGQRSLVGSSPWGRKESDTTEKLHFHFHKQCCYCCVNLSQHVNKQSVKLTTEFNILGKFHY